MPLNALNVVACKRRIARSAEQIKRESPDFLSPHVLNHSHSLRCARDSAERSGAVKDKNSNARFESFASYRAIRERQTKSDRSSEAKSR